LAIAPKAIPTALFSRSQPALTMLAHPGASWRILALGHRHVGLATHCPVWDYQLLHSCREMQDVDRL
jgi:hypothetical protein